MKTTKPKIHAVSIEAFQRALMLAGYTPRDAKLQAKIATILGSKMKIDGTWFRVKGSK